MNQRAKTTRRNDPNVKMVKAVLDQVFKKRPTSQTSRNALSTSRKTIASKDVGTDISPSKHPKYSTLETAFTCNDVSPLDRYRSVALLMEKGQNRSDAINLEGSTYIVYSSDRDRYGHGIVAYTRRRNHKDMDVPTKTNVSVRPDIENVQQLDLVEERMVALLDNTDIFNDEALRAMVQCKRCDSTHVQTMTVQIASADEGMTTFCTCPCGNRWKVRT